MVMGEIKAFLRPWPLSTSTVFPSLLLTLVCSLSTALSLVNQQRNAYGLRYNDHARYRWATRLLDWEMSVLNLCQKTLRKSHPSPPLQPQNDAWKGSRFQEIASHYARGHKGGTVSLALASIALIS